MTLTSAEIVDTRRYCGYPVSAAVATYPDESVRANSDMLDIILASLTADQEAILRTTYLTNLKSLEAAVPAAGENLDTAKAAVWTHNENELADRQGLFFSWRQQLAGFLGVTPGPGVYVPTTNAGGNPGLVPAIFVV